MTRIRVQARLSSQPPVCSTAFTTFSAPVIRLAVARVDLVLIAAAIRLRLSR